MFDRLWLKILIYFTLMFKNQILKSYVDTLQFHLVLGFLSASQLSKSQLLHVWCQLPHEPMCIKHVHAYSMDKILIIFK